MAWDEDIRIGVLEEFASAGVYSSDDAFKAEEFTSASRRAYASDYYQNVIKASRVVMQAHRKNQRDSVAVIRARRKAEGKCTFCEELRDPQSKALCARHRAESQSTWRKRGMREKMPDLREGLTHHFTITTRCHKLKCVAGKVEGTDELCATCSGFGVEGVDGYITTGLYPDGRVGEIFLKVGGHASDKFIMLDQWAIAFSVALQYGAPLEVLCTKFRGQNFWPDGPTNNDKIKRCSSLVDYCVRYLMLKYVMQPTTVTVASPANGEV